MRLHLRTLAVCLLAVMLVFANTSVFAAVAKPVTAKANTKTDSKKDNIVKTAEKYLKTPYKFGGDSPKGFDCSGFTKFVYERNGSKLPRTADIQYKQGKAVERSKLKPGDLVFFTTYEPGPSHVGIYYGNGKFIHASSSRGVILSRLDETYWKPRYLGARRIIN